MVIYILLSQFLDALLYFRIRFCTSGILSNGATYFDLLWHARKIVEENVEIVYGPP